MVRLYTIGFTKKTAEVFFGLLVENKVNALWDVRLNNSSQFTRFTHKDDLPYFLNLHSIKYKYCDFCAPSKELLYKYKKGIISWQEYKENYLDILKKRDILERINLEEINGVVFLCSEASPEKCHRRLLAEYLAENLDNIEILHL